MYEFLSHDGTLIQWLFPDLAAADVVFTNRLAKLVQFFSAFVIVVEIFGIDRVNKLVDLASAPFVNVHRQIKKAIDSIRDRTEPNEDPDADVFPIWTFPAYTLFAVMVWWIFSDQPLTYWLTNPFIQLARIIEPFRELTMSAWLPVTFGWAVIKAMWFYMWAGVQIGMFVVYPMLGPLVLIGEGAEYFTRTDIKETAFRATFFLLFTLGFFVDFMTSR